jgi:hypothetical protein
MHDIVSGFVGWIRMHKAEHKAVHSIDTAITVVATLLVAITFTIVHF